MRVFTGKEEVEVCDIGNYTFNVSPMYYQVFTLSEGLRGMDGMNGEQAYPIVHEAINQMIEREEELTLLNPDNGWGNFDGALHFLEKIRQACEDHPLAILRIT